MNPDNTDESVLISQHVADHNNHRFQPVVYNGNYWDFSHLDPFAFRVDIGDDRHVFVVVLFTCHCFTHSLKNDDREVIPQNELYSTYQETRVLNEERYNLSKTLLCQIMREMHLRHITVADPSRNFVTFEHQNQDGKIMYYGVFFEASKDKFRGGRIILRVQTAYLLKSMNKRLQSARKVRFSVLIKAIYEGRQIRP
jgi:hypothetical protein